MIDVTVLPTETKQYSHILNNVFSIINRSQKRAETLEALCLLQVVLVILLLHTSSAKRHLNSEKREVVKFNYYDAKEICKINSRVPPVQVQQYIGVKGKVSEFQYVTIYIRL